MDVSVPTILLVINVLETLDIDYLIGGSFASTAFGRIRLTQDVGIIASTESSHVDPCRQRIF